MEDSEVRDLHAILLCLLNLPICPITDSILGETFATINPATGEKICDVSAASKEDIGTIY